MGNASKTFAITAAVFVMAHAAGARAATNCDRSCLDGLADRYMDAMAAKTPADLPWAKVVRYSENSVPMAIGDGLWATISAHSPTALRAADPSTGQAAWIGTVDEHGQPAFFALRLKIRDRQIVEAEAVVRRKGGPPQFGDPGQYAHDPSFAAATPGRPLSRAQLISLVSGYFDGLQGAARAHPRFDHACARLDNGVATTIGDTAEGGVQGCQAQFKAGVFSPVRRVRDRRFPIVDAARGVVVAAGFLDLPANSDKATPARPLSWATTYPYSIGFIAAFKIRDGGIYRVDSVSGALPYLMPSPWSGDAPLQKVAAR